LIPILGLQKSEVEMKRKEGVLLDTSFFLRFLNEEDPLFAHADQYFRHFINSDIDLYISVVSIGEFCVSGSIEELPLKNLKIIPYNFDHAIRAAQFAKIGFKKRKSDQLKVERIIIPNDTKLFAQADLNPIKYYLSSDQSSIKLFQSLRTETTLNFEFIDLHTPCNEFFGTLF